MALDVFLKSTSFKFSLWNFARRNPRLGSPIVYLGRQATRRIQENYHHSLEHQRKDLCPIDRYQRPLETPTQLLVVVGEDADPDDRAGAVLLLNHLRLPYRLIELGNRPTPTPPIENIAVAIFLGRDPITTSFYLDSLDPRCTILHLSPKKWAKANLGDRLKQVDASFKDLLPWKEGLLSPLAASLIQLLMQNAVMPLVTGMLPAGVALRIDDADGQAISRYLPPILKQGWKPNIGLFLNGIAQAGNSVRALLAEEAHEGRLDTSPHAFAADDFIFFNYPHGKPWSQAAFLERWKRVKHSFSDWSFMISPVLNSHFHALSSICLPTLAEEGILYHYSELALDETIRQPRSSVLPSGDPEVTTGQLGHPGFQQIYSGDSTLYCNRPASHYDFLMHTRCSDQPHASAVRLLDRLRLTLQCGFASFVTTHEYLLAQLPERINQALWDEVESVLASQLNGPPKKISLIELGRRCSDHTTTVIESVYPVDNGRWRIRLSGLSAGAGVLSVFRNGICREVPIPAFENAYEMEVSL